MTRYPRDMARRESRFSSAPPLPGPRGRTAARSSHREGSRRGRRSPHAPGPGADRLRSLLRRVRGARREGVQARWVAAPHWTAPPGGGTRGRCPRPPPRGHQRRAADLGDDDREPIMDVKELGGRRIERSRITLWVTSVTILAPLPRPPRAGGVGAPL